MFKPFSIIKWLILIATYLFLGYKLATFNHYNEFLKEWKQIPLTQFVWLLGVFALLPFNWFLEAIKWKMLCSNIQKLSFVTAIKAVLAGISSGFFTPNRVGELVGRIMFLNVENRKSGVTLSVVNSLTQNIVMALCGIPAFIFFYLKASEKLEINMVQYVGALATCILVFSIFYFCLPLLSKRLKISKMAAKITPFTDCLTGYKFTYLVSIMLVSMLRYTVFCTQFYLMLSFFSIDLTVWQAIICIPSIYLLVTFTPSLAFSEVAIRSSFAVLIIGAYSHNIVGIALAGMCLWIINFVLPMLMGSVIMVRAKF
jgi:hypothetical protein